MKQWLSLVSVGCCLSSGFAYADSTSTTVSAGQGIAIALPIVAGGISLYKGDITGVAELSVDTVLTVGTAYGLSRIVREERPDHSDQHSFPSDTAALAFAPAAYLWDRYGWSYGAPAYAAAAFVAYSRVDGQKHHWWDVVASAGIGWTYSQIFTTRYRGSRLSASIAPMGNGAMARINYRW